MNLDLFRRRTSPPPKEAAAKGQFKAKATMDLETVTARLAEIEAEIADGEAELSRISLNAVLSDDQNAGFECVGRLSELRTRRELLQRALSAAQQAENERIAGLKSKADKARSRALSQHLALMERHAVSIVAAQSAVRDHFRQLVNAADGVRANLPKHLNGHVQEGLTNQLSADSLRFLTEVSAYGLSQEGIPAPFCTRAPPNAHTIDGWSGDWPGLIELVGTRIVQPLKRLSDPPSPLSPGDTGGAGVARALAGVAISADPSSDGRVEPTPATPVEIDRASSSSVDARPTDASHPLAPVAAAAAQTLPPSLAGVVVRNGVMTDQTSRQISPEPYSEPVEELIADAGEDTIGSETPSPAPRYTEAEAL
jgi:hypothetical protein